MTWRRVWVVLVAVLCSMMATVGQQTGSGIGWYNGQWQSGVPGLSNWYRNPGDFARVYDPFEVPDGGWTVTGVFSDNRLDESRIVTQASWEIRRGMAPGRGGAVVVADRSPANISPDPSVTSDRYPSDEVMRHFRIQVDDLHVRLPAGQYWLSVAPVGQGRFYAGATLGSGAVGVDRDQLPTALFDRPHGPRFVAAESVGQRGQAGIARHFAQGVIIAR